MVCFEYVSYLPQWYLTKDRHYIQHVSQHIWNWFTWKRCAPHICIRTCSLKAIHWNSNVEQRQSCISAAFALTPVKQSGLSARPQNPGPSSSGSNRVETFFIRVPAVIQSNVIFGACRFSKTVDFWNICKKYLHWYFFLTRQIIKIQKLNMKSC